MEGSVLHDTQRVPGKDIIMNFPLTDMAAQQWQLIAQQNNIVDDSAVASLLLRRYAESGDSQSRQLYCQICSCPLSHFCSACFSLMPKHQQQINSREAVVSTEGDGDILRRKSPEAVTVDKGAAVGFKAENNTEELSSSVFQNSASSNASDNESESEDISYDEQVGLKFEADFSKPSATKTDPADISSGRDQSESFPCSVCLQVFPDPDLLVIHTQEHSDQMGHECGECKARFFQHHTLQLHMKTHSQNLKKYACDQCDVFMSRLDNLNRHKALKHNKKDKKTHSGYNLDEEEESFKNVAKFTCDKCQKGFSRKDNFNRHMLTHSGEKRFGCQQCGAAFAHLSKLVTHMHSHSRQKPFQCGTCHKYFVDAASMTKHACRPTEPKHRCNVCEKTFPTSSQLILHSRFHLDKNGTSQISADDMSNKSCDRKTEHLKDQDTKHLRERRNRNSTVQTFQNDSPSVKTKRISRKEESKRTLPSSTPDEEASQNTPQADDSHPHCCQLCGARFLFPTHLTRHMQQHTGQKAFKCSQCHVSCRSLARLHIHMRSHSTVKDFPCHYCGKVLKSAYALKLHLCSHTGERPFKCEECGEGFTHKSKYNDHLDVHAGERRHLCPYCGKAFLRSSNLSGHIRIHTHTKKVYPCQYCGKMLRSRNTLREHLRSHTGEKPFKCDICGACFMRSGTYKTHLRKHSGVRPHLCTFCGKSFLHPCHLRVHVRIHTGEKPYKCSQCPKSFSILAGLKEHMRKHTGDKPFKCSVCGKGFAKSCNRLAHFRTHSKSQGNPPAQNDPVVG